MFENELTKLGNAIREVVTKEKEAKAIATRRSVRVRRRDFSLLYTGNIEFPDVSASRIEEDTWDPDDYERFQHFVIEQMEEYKSLVSTLGAKGGLVEGFARAVCFASFQGLDEKELIERAASRGRELDGLPLPVRVTAFVSGLSIQDSPLVISDRLTLRKPSPEDMTQEILLDDYGGYSFPRNQTWFSVVGEFNFDAISTGLAQKDFLRTIDALRLFRLGGVAANRYRMTSSHSFPDGEISGPDRHSRFSYTLSRSEAPILRKFLDDITPVLPDPFNLDKATTEREIAYSRYVDALFQTGPSERAITSAITALEALFLQGQPELSHRLAQRVALFLRVLATQADAQSTYHNVKKGYGVRSKFIHGSSLEAKDRPQADSLAPVLLEYARQSVLSFFQLPTSKDELLGQLDRAMIHLACAEELNKSVGSVLHK